MEDQKGQQILNPIATEEANVSPLIPGSDIASALSPSPINPRGLSKRSLGKQSIGGESSQQKGEPLLSYKEYGKMVEDYIEKNLNDGIEEKLASNDADFMAAYRVSFFY